MSKDLYEILEVDRSATIAEIKSAYRKLAVKYHPDKTNDQSLNQKFLEIKQAYEILSDEYKRNLYDLTQSEIFANNYEEIKRNTYRRPPPPFVVYQTQKVEFSPRTYFYGFLFVLGIIALAIALPVVLMTRSANIHFEKGLQYYHSGMYSDAIDSFTKAVNDLGGKSGLANYYNAYILFHEYDNHRITIKYINESLEDIDDDSIASELYWMKGRCYEEANLFDEALKYYQNVQNFSTAYDSAMLHKGIIYSVNKNNYALGAIYFDSLLFKNGDNYIAKYFKAYSLQKMDEHKEALQLFEEIEEESDYARGSVYLHKAQSELKLDMKDIACDDLQKAINLNSADAKKLYKIYCY